MCPTLLHVLTFSFICETAIHSMPCMPPRLVFNKVTLGRDSSSCSHPRVRHTSRASHLSTVPTVQNSLLSYSVLCSTDSHLSHPKSAESTQKRHFVHKNSRGLILSYPTVKESRSPDSKGEFGGNREVITGQQKTQTENLLTASFQVTREGKSFLKRTCDLRGQCTGSLGWFLLTW